MSWYLYIAQAQKTGNYYVGISTDVKKRIIAHNKGKGSVMAKTQGPFKLVFKSKRLPNQSVARKLEIKTKAFTRKQRGAVVCGTLKLPHIKNCLITD